MRRMIVHFFLFIVLLIPVNAQQNDWFSTLFVEPTPSPYLSDWESNPMLGRFTLTYSGSDPVSFIFAVRITSPQYGELVTARSGQIDYPSGPYTQIYTPYDVLSWNDVRGLQFNSAMRERIVRSGRFPEGNFTLEILVKTLSGTVLNSATADFTIAYPEPPQLILPQNEDIVVMTQPIFQWTIVNTPPTMPVTYKIKIVEKLTGQNPAQALAANPVHHLDSVSGIGLYTYPASGFPFQNGKEYIWQISATDQNGSVVTSNNGRSEIWSFYFGSMPSEDGLPFDTLTIVPDMAYLINLRSLTVTEDMNSYIINGNTSLILKLGGSEQTISVTLENIIIQKGFYTPPMILGGNFSATINPNVIPQSVLGEYFRATNIQFSLMDGLTLGGELRLPGLSSIALQGRLTINSLGISGALSVERPANNPLYTLGEGIGRMLITQASVHFSDPVVNLGGILQVFGQNSGCNIQQLQLGSDGSITGSASCNPNIPVSLVPGSNRLQLTFNSIAGDFSANIVSGTFSFNFTANTGLDFRATDTSTYGADLVVGLSNSGFNLVSFTPRGNITPPAIDLGWVKIALSNLDLSQLSFANGNWNFAMGMDIQILFPAFNNLSLPVLNGATLGTSGLTIPNLNLSSASLPPFEFQGFRFEMLSARMPSVTIPFFSSGAGATSGMNFSFDFRLRMPNIPGGNFADRVFNITNATFNNGSFSAQLQPTTFPDPGINLDLVPGISFNLKELSGSISAGFSGSTPTFNPSLRVRGNLSLPPIFSGSSGPGMAAMNLMSTTLAMDGNGKISGRIENINPACSIDLQLLNIVFSNIAVDFNLSGSEQRINLEGAVNIRLANPSGGNIEGSGTINYEVISNTLVSLNTQINNPFTINIPQQNPVFSFQVPRATITQESFILDGRSYLNLGGGVNIGVTFRNFNLRWRDFTVASGDVVFDVPFAFKVTLENGNLSFRTVPANSGFTEPTGLMLNLPSSFSLGADGFTATGASRINLRFQGTDLDSLLANFSQDFALALSPFNVRAGQAEFFLQNRRVAYLNSNGFFPDLAYFASSLLPARIPLPIESIGYLQIKQGETFLVDYASVSNGVRINTREGQPIKLVLPILRFSRPSNPELDVNFDIILNTQTMQLVSGSIDVSIPTDQRANWDLSSFGVPFSIADIRYGEFSGGTGFRLSGNIKAFGNDLGDPVDLIIYSNGRITGDVDFTLSRSIQIIPESDKLVLNISRVAGSLDIQLSPLNLNFDIGLTGGLRLNLGDGQNYGANATFRLSQSGLSVDNLTVDTPPQMPRLDFSWLKLGLSNFTVPNLTYDPNTGWDFELRLSVQLDFPELNFRLPTITGLSIRPNGITIPAISIPEITDSFRNFFGFAIKPLAFRMQPFTFNWFTMEGTSLNDWGFSFDFELGFSQMPASVPEALRNARVRILNAGFNRGRITGDIQVQDFNAPGLQLPLGGSTNFLIKRIGGTLSDIGDDQNFNITIGGDIQLPEFMRCGGSTGVAPVVGTTLTIDSRGKIFGRINNFVPPCPVNLGIGIFTITNSSLDFSAGSSNQRLIIELAGNLRLPSPTSGDSITASGNLTFDLLNANMIDGQIAINTPFRLQIPNDNPVLVFTINNALLNHQGLRINGTSALNLGNGATLNANFDNFLFNFKELTVTSGTASFMGQFALKFVVESGGLRWSAVPLNAGITEQTVVRLTLPNNISLSSEGIGASGETSILVRVGGRDYANVRCVFSNDFLISYSPFRVNRGSARFYLGETLAGVLDRNGFAPGDILGMLPIPEKLPLPDTTIAYLVLKEGNNLLVQTETVPNGLRISTRPGQRIKLIIPGLKFGGQTPPELLIAFSVTVNTTTFALVEGSISVSPSPGSTTLFSLNNLGIPLNITQLEYERINGLPVLRAAARLNLPASLNNAVVTMDSLVISPNGFAGNIRVGTYNVHHSNDETYFATVNIGSSATFKLSGFVASISNSNTNIRMCGDITADIFRDNSNQLTPLHWFAVWQNGQFNFSFDLSHVPNMRIPLLFANFQPLSIGGNPSFNLEVSSSVFALTLSGILRIPSINDNFSVSFSGLRISNSGITIPSVSITAPSSMQNLNLFGAQFALRNLSASERAISFEYTNRTLFITLNGDISFFGNTSQFRGLRIGSNGSVSINQANLISNPFFIVQNYVGISRLSIGSSGMRVDGFIKLPKPADTTRQAFNFSVNSQGQVSGGTNISLVNENAGLGGGDQTEWNFWIAKFDLTYARINLNFSNFRQSTLHVISDIYFMNDANKYIRLGYKQGGTPYPGLTVRFDGNIQWGNVQVSQSLSNIDWEAIKINLTQANINNDAAGNFRLAVSGRLSIGLDGVSGGLNFNNLRISSSGGVENLGSSITGGVLSIANIVNLTVNNVGYSSSPTFIWVKGGQFPQGNGGVANVDSQRIQVTSFFRFAASISITGIASGGIEEFLMYKTASSTNLTIRNANLSIPGVLTFRADLVYKRSGTGFYLLLGGKGRIASRYEVKMIGKIAQSGGNTSFGVFVAATGLNITIPPAIVLTGLGGGFFYNPDNSDLALVRSMCGLDPGSMGRVQTTPGRFAVLIFAQASIISNTVASGKILLTVTQNYFELYGQVVLLNQSTYFNGSIFLHVGFTNSIAEGNISITLNISPLLRGNASLAFYFYPNNIWGVDGRLTVRILNIVNCNAEVFVGNPGFYISMGASVNINIWIFSVDAGMQITIWNIRSNGSWGAHGSAWIRGRICGITIVGLSFQAAMINNSKSLIYGEASFEVLWWTEHVWGAIENGSTRGGLGTNSNYRNQISAAVTAAQNMRNQRNAALQQINNIRGH
ncbi:MAG: hypothetical protein AB9882_03595 [Ignavibacteriaceae bacterium]